MSINIPKKDATPGLWLSEGKLLTVRYFYIKDSHQTDPNMERVEFMTRKDSPMKDIIRRNIEHRGNMVVNVCRVVKTKGTEIILYH